MADELTVDVDRLPTLTEVLELGRDGVAGVSAGGPRNDSELVAQVLGLLEPRIGGLLEARLREALAPALARAADSLIRDVRAEMAPTLRSLVEEAVAQALRQPRSPK